MPPPQIKSRDKTMVKEKVEDCVNAQELVSVYKFRHLYTKNNTRYVTPNDPE
jgi:hypothetical protein